jgi:FtsP/CotA-like multicopper oxidase with cupredoxin domain
MPSRGSRPSTVFRALVASGLFAVARLASAQIIINPLPAGATPSGVFNAFPAQNPLGPTGASFQTSYPYPGQCLTDGANAGLFPGLGACAGGSFSPFQRSASDWVDQTGKVSAFKTLNPVFPPALVVPALPATFPQTKFRWPVLNPPDYSPDQTSFPNADYYELGVHEAWGFDAIAKAGLFPNPAGQNVPNGMQWTGLVCNIPAGCACPADASASFQSSYCTIKPAAAGANPKIPFGNPLYTPIFGIGQINQKGGPVTQVLQGLGLFTPPNPATQPAWSSNQYVATWPSISIRGTRGRPVVVKWTNEFPNNHVLCPHPEAADWPCAIDRTFMGVKLSVDPALPRAVPANKVNPYGGPQQPDTSWVTHLHGGEIPPGTDGFAEKWFGNANTSVAYTNLSLNPPFENPRDLVLARPSGNSDTYTYPMVQEEALIWFHDHTLGKTHHNVIAGPAGFFPVVDPGQHGGTGAYAGKCPMAPDLSGPLASCQNSYTWLDPVTQPRNGLGIPLYDLFLALQDRAFNEDGSINFSNGLGQVLPPGVVLPVGYSSITPGVNPMVHPTWIPEYFGDHVLVNGVLWPQFTAVPGWYRIRIADGSDSRCWTLGLTNTFPAPGTAPKNDALFYVIANDQGYLGTPAQVNTVTMCPGERYELLIDLTKAKAGMPYYLTNNAPAPFPAGITPMDPKSPYADMNVVMRFDIVAPTASNPGVQTCAKGTTGSWDPGWASTNTGQASMIAAISAKTACMPAAPQGDPTFVAIHPVVTNQGNIPFPAKQPNGSPTVVRQMYLNERADGVNLAPLGMQLNGVPFEYKVTETPKKGSREYWQFVNLTVDAHPMHPHYAKHQIVARQAFSVGGYKAALCGSTTCQPGTSPGGEMQVVPDVNAFVTGTIIPPPAFESGWKDASKVPPGQVTTIVADWIQRYDSSGPANAPGTAGCPSGQAGCAATCTGGYCSYKYDDVTSGPFVWHCHINSHEDSEMMRTSLVVP